MFTYDCIPDMGEAKIKEQFSQTSEGENYLVLEIPCVGIKCEEKTSIRIDEWDIPWLVEDGFEV